MRQLIRLLFGLSLGFVGAFVTITAIDRYGDEPGTGEQLEAVLGRPDFAKHCAAGQDPRRALNTTGDPFGWRCVGRVNGIWSVDGIDVGAVCRAQFSEVALERLDEATTDDEAAWFCVERR